MRVFQVVDLVSQRDAVRAQVEDKSTEEIVNWLSRFGRISSRVAAGVEHFYFVSACGREAIFFFESDGDFVFVGDHTTFR